MADVPKPITREDMYYNYLINGAGVLPKPITRKEIYLNYLCQNGGMGGGNVTPDMIENAVNQYLEENPPEASIDYADITGKPKINGVELSGNLSLSDIGIDVSGDSDDIDFSGMF